MALITFISDFGESDHYVASVKARILSVNPGLQIIDISHHIQAHNLAHGAFVIKSVYRDFAKGTVHLVSIDTLGSANYRFLAFKIEDHFFVAPDNGICSLISEKEPAIVADITGQVTRRSSFPSRDILAKAAALLASGTNLQDMGTFTTDYKKLIGRQFRASKKQISGSVIRVDHYGNLITNIEETVFNQLCNNHPFTINFARESVTEINQGYGQVEDGDCFVIFNSLGLMEIGIFRGNASELLGLDYDSPINIYFRQDES
jgi:S-adenosylmethionine hydrolase